MIVIYNITADIYYVNTDDFRYTADIMEELNPSNPEKMIMEDA